MYVVKYAYLLLFLTDFKLVRKLDIYVKTKRSLDLTKIEIFLWVYVKNEVYKIPPTTREEMKVTIRKMFQNTSVRMLRNIQHFFFENRL